MPGIYRFAAAKTNSKQQFFTGGLIERADDLKEPHVY